mmetsp:Transcript_65063/g.117040  ORF Transcript_65063/g.117040 Transcript_65063/m.117040 type:complete len:106 (+) Transcript_65063:201-518(+)
MMSFSAKAFLAVVLFLCQVTSFVVAQMTGTSSALTEARNCIINGGLMNFYRSPGDETHAPSCRYEKQCPDGSVEAWRSCVLKEVPGRVWRCRPDLDLPFSEWRVR